MVDWSRADDTSIRIRTEEGDEALAGGGPQLLQGELFR